VGVGFVVHQDFSVVFLGVVVGFGEVLLDADTGFVDGF